MNKIILIFFVNVVLTIPSIGQNQYERIKVTNDIDIIKISNNSYLHVSYTQMPGYGRVASNGLIFIENGEAALFDTPMTEPLTKDLVNWIKETLKVNIILFAPTHWHNDCIGGLAYLNSLGIESYANELTIQIAKSNNLPLPQHGFKDSITLRLGDKKIICDFLGAAHSTDNIVFWIPSERILFAGCMAKEITSTHLGNTADGDLRQYPVTIEKVLKKYTDAEIVIPGHGQFGGIELLKHTLELAKQSKPGN